MPTEPGLTSSTPLAARRANGRWVWPKISRRSVTPASSSSSSSPGSGRNERTSETGEACQQRVPSPRSTLGGSAASSSTSAVPSASRPAAIAPWTTGSRGASPGAPAQALDRSGVGEHRLQRGEVAVDVVEERDHVGSRMLASGPTITLRYPSAADAPALFELANDPAVTRYFSWSYTAEDDAAWWIAGRGSS
jgi:hypothetical protein